MTPSKKTLNRRDFIAKAFAGAGAATLLGCADKPSQDRTASSPTVAAAAVAPARRAWTRRP